VEEIFYYKVVNARTVHQGITKQAIRIATPVIFFANNVLDHSLINAKAVINLLFYLEHNVFRMLDTKYTAFT
jgi:hypothetical protein